MYNERNEGFSLKEVILRLLFIVLFVFILIWLFPTRSTVEKNTNNYDILTDRIFGENIKTMKEAAIGYYTTPRLPVNVGDKEKLTLAEMLELNLLVDFVDGNGKACDTEASYVEIVKYKDEYQLKVNLSCTDNDAYIIVYLGCYSYCQSEICQKNEPEIIVENASAPTCSLRIKSGTKNTDGTYTGDVVIEFASKKADGDATLTSFGLGTSSNYNGDTTFTISKSSYGQNTIYGYVKDSNGKTGSCKISLKIKDGSTNNVSYRYRYSKDIATSCTNWSNWSDWQDTSITATNNREVQAQLFEKKTSEYKIVGYETVTKEDKTKPIYGDVQIQIGTKTVTTCTKYETQTVHTGEYKGQWVSKGTSVYYYTPTNTTTEKYVYVSTTTYACGNCLNGFAEMYEKLVYETYEIVTTENVCVETKVTEEPIYATVQDIVGYETYDEQVAIWDTVTTSTYFTKYRLRTRTCTNGYTDYKWSTSSNDQTLINQGYVYTGYKEIIE